MEPSSSLVCVCADSELGGEEGERFLLKSPLPATILLRRENEAEQIQSQGILGAIS